MSNKVDTGGKRLNLFPAKKQKKKLPVDDKVFNMMEAVADKSYVNISDMSQPKVEKSTKSIHNALMAAGMTPAYGNIADLADATLYALEGEFGDAAWSAAAAIPVIGQMVSGKRALKAAKESGERIFPVYRTAEKWYPGKMVRDGKFTGKAGEEIYTSLRKDVVDNYRRAFKHNNKDLSPIMLEFELPESWIRKNMKQALRPGWDRGLMHEFHTNPIPKEFLKKVHK